MHVLRANCVSASSLAGANSRRELVNFRLRFPMGLCYSKKQTREVHRKISLSEFGVHFVRERKEIDKFFKFKSCRKLHYSLKMYVKSKTGRTVSTLESRNNREKIRILASLWPFYEITARYRVSDPFQLLTVNTKTQHVHNNSHKDILITLFIATKSSYSL